MKITYSIFCSGCGTEIPMEASPQSEVEWKDIQRHINKKVGRCAECQRADDDIHFEYD
jgi:hypothetical protein